MKITKRNILTENKKLHEADETTTVSLDPVSLSGSEQQVADEVAAQLAAADGISLDDEAAEGTAKDAQEIGDAIGAEDVTIAVEDDVFADESLHVVNKMTQKFDKALAKSLALRDRRDNNKANVLIIGLPGSGKTASVYDWASHAKANGERIHITYVNAKNNDLDAWMNGYTAIDPEQARTVTQFTSNNLAGLERPNSVLFIDEYNRQVKQQVRASLLTLINEHYVVGNSAVNPNDKDGKHYFNNFLFTIAAMNPYLGQYDEGAARLNGAELSRFAYTIKNADSDSDTCVAYLTKQYNKFAAQAFKNGDPNKTYHYLAAQYIGVALVSDEEFKFSDTNDAMTCAKHGTNIVNQRLITTGLSLSLDDIDELIEWVEDDANLEEEDATMITDILRVIASEMPTKDELFEAAADAILKDFKVDILAGQANNAPAAGVAAGDAGDAGDG